MQTRAYHQRFDYPKSSCQGTMARIVQRKCKNWNTALNKLPKNIYNFTQRYLNNTAIFKQHLANAEKHV